MKRIEKISVFFHEGTQKQKIGTLALYKKQLAAFEYAPAWLSEGFSISPFSLPLQPGVFIPDFDPFYGLHGVFNDSLPDGWGRLLVDRMLQKNHIPPEELTVLDRLAIVGASGMGALSYEPETFLSEQIDLSGTYDELAESCNAILTGHPDTEENLDSLFLAGGSSGGARPKIFAKIRDEDWIIKFPATTDSNEIGLQEYEYNSCAKKCGIQTSPIKLFDSRRCPGYFGTKRFDRTADGGRIHFLSAGALLETSHRIPNLDYNTLMLMSLKLSNDSTQTEQLFRRMVFNVFAHNRDDHAKNFSWLYDSAQEKWLLTPAYDLTYSSSIGGEHATTINGEGKNPSEKDMLAVALKNGIKKSAAIAIIKNISETVQMELGRWIFG